MKTRFLCALLVLVCLMTLGCTATAADKETVIVLSDGEITVDGQAASRDESAAVYLSNDIIYYEDRTAYDSGNPYGEGTVEERHSADEAAAHTVVNIAKPGTYRISGTLSAGQIRVDLGEDADKDPNAVVTLVLDNLTITCTVAPGIVFMNVYECDGDWSTDTASSTVDTTAAGANIVLAQGSVNTVNGGHVARIYKDKEGEKKLWKQDGAVYSYMSMNVNAEGDGSGVLNINADNEGLDTELHLTINGGNIHIFADNDGINTNEDYVSVTTINGGNIHILAGLGVEGDGIDSNGWLVINGGTVISAANPAADAGLDSDMGSFVNGGTVVALGSTMDWAESDSEQVTLNLQFADYNNSGDAIVICDTEGTPVFAYDPSADEVTGSLQRRFQGCVISTPALQLEGTYTVHIGGDITGTEVEGVYDTSTITAYENGRQQIYTGTDVMSFPHFGAMGGFGDRQNPFGNAANPLDTLPREQYDALAQGEVPAGMTAEDLAKILQDVIAATGNNASAPAQPEMPPNDGFQPSDGSFGGQAPVADADPADARSLFYMQDKVNCFSGVDAAE